MNGIGSSRNEKALRVARLSATAFNARTIWVKLRLVKLSRLPRSG